ncbi:o-succinylbenzoate synthase [Photobacterium sp. WH77]|uniref:o-succinylbenzoate synthase n=1 Tax=unclassified Photobacterium TaxID=2628852 RepID=UPI001ED9D6D4|nr:MULTISPECIES: o-succinylbenzoate synthase [unclassified Photobacterium]MCG2838746.1 o-succinylbenzoate synthase [Photobacterium sp. WH77]MCG2846333.1 o-succinylbenzoate synthase [Photobacterium sp. WH80]
MTRSASLYRYRLPMDTGVILRGRRLTERIGYIAELREGARIGRGEIAPLPGFSVECADQAGQQSLHALKRWVAGQDIMACARWPSVAFGLSMAALELQGELPITARYQTVPLLSHESVNAGAEGAAANLSVPADCRLAKLKLGRGSPQQDAVNVSALLKAHPSLMLRLDANCAWSLPQAREFARHLAPDHASRIAFIEEPCQRPADSLTFSKETGLALAWDETLQAAVRQPGFTLDTDFRLDSLSGANTLVIKPTLIGSVQRCIALIRQAQQTGTKAVISASLESSLGLTQLARLSCWLLPGSVPGLDTLSLFRSQLELTWPGSTLPVKPLQQQTRVWHS